MDAPRRKEEARQDDLQSGKGDVCRNKEGGSRPRSEDRLPEVCGEGRHWERWAGAMSVIKSLIGRV